jgi:hypothetical protein
MNRKIQKKNKKIVASDKEKEIEKFLKTVPPEILSTLGIVVAFYAVGILNHFLIRKDLTKNKKVL